MFFDGMTSFEEFRELVELHGQVGGSQMSETTKSLLLRFKKITAI